MVVEDVATGQFICSDDSLDPQGRYESEAIAVRGLEAGKAYLVQVAGRKRHGSPDRSSFYGVP